MSFSKISALRLWVLLNFQV